MLDEIKNEYKLKLAALEQDIMAVDDRQNNSHDTNRFILNVELFQFITTKYQAHIQSSKLKIESIIANNTKLDLQQKYDNRIAKLKLEKQELLNGITEVVQNATMHADEKNRATRMELQKSSEYLNQFKLDNQPYLGERLPDKILFFGTPFRRYFEHYKLLGWILMIESALTIMMYWKIIPPSESIFIGLFVSFINIAFQIFFGRLMRGLNLNKKKKPWLHRIGGISLLFSAVFMYLWPNSVGNLHSICSNPTLGKSCLSGVSIAASGALTFFPVALGDDRQALIIFLVMVLFAIKACHDGYKDDDPLPGYVEVSMRYATACEKYDQLTAMPIKDIESKKLSDSIPNDEFSKIKEDITNLQALPGACINIKQMLNLHYNTYSQDIRSKYMKTRNNHAVYPKWTNSIEGQWDDPTCLESTLIQRCDELQTSYSNYCNDIVRFKADCENDIQQSKIDAKNKILAFFKRMRGEVHR
jgi:hypothetical protein